MRNKLSLTFLTASLFALTFAARPANAQFENQKNFLGAHIGLSGVGSALTLGADYERGITNVGEVGPGIIGVGGLFDYFSYGSSDYGYSDVGSWTYIDFGVTGMYHFVLSDKKWDPFVGLVLGYEVASWKWKGEYSYLNSEYGYSPSAGGFTLGGSAGIRYFLSDNWTAQARVGFGFYILAVGVDYKF